MGDWMQTFSGGQFWPLEPRSGEVEDRGHRACAVDAVPLCRALHPLLFGGRALGAPVSPRFSRHALWALLHDASEAICLDVIGRSSVAVRLLRSRGAGDGGGGQALRAGAAYAGRNKWMIADGRSWPTRRWPTCAPASSRGRIGSSRLASHSATGSLRWPSVPSWNASRSWTRVSLVDLGDAACRPGALLRRLEAGEELRLVLGEGVEACEIRSSGRHREGIRAEWCARSSNGSSASGTGWSGRGWSHDRSRRPGRGAVGGSSRKRCGRSDGTRCASSPWRGGGAAEASRADLGDHGRLPPGGGGG